MTNYVDFATFTQTVIIRTVLRITEVYKISSKAGSGINILYLLTGPVYSAEFDTWHLGDRATYGDATITCIRVLSIFHIPNSSYDSVHALCVCVCVCVRQDFKKFGVFDAQEQLERRHREEEDELYGQMVAERRRQMDELEQSLADERQHTVRQLIAWFESQHTAQQQRDDSLSKVIRVHHFS